MGKWLKSKAAKIIITALLSAGLLSAGVNPKIAGPIMAAAESVLNEIFDNSEPIVVKEAVENEQ